MNRYLPAPASSNPSDSASPATSTTTSNINTTVLSSSSHRFSPLLPPSLATETNHLPPPSRYERAFTPPPSSSSSLLSSSSSPHRAASSRFGPMDASRQMGSNSNSDMSQHQRFHSPSLDKVTTTTTTTTTTTGNAMTVMMKRMDDDFQLFGGDDDDEQQQGILGRKTDLDNYCAPSGGNDDLDTFFDFDTFAAEAQPSSSSISNIRSPNQSSPFTFDLDDYSVPSPDLIPDSPSSSPHSYSSSLPYPTHAFAQLFPPLKSSIEEVKQHFASIDLRAYSTQLSPAPQLHPFDPKQQQAMSPSSISFLPSTSATTAATETVSPLDVSPNLLSSSYELDNALNYSSLFAHPGAYTPIIAMNPAALGGGSASGHKRGGARKSMSKIHPFSIAENSMTWESMNGAEEEIEVPDLTHGSMRRQHRSTGSRSEDGEDDDDDSGSDSSLVSPPLSFPLILSDPYFGTDYDSHSNENALDPVKRRRDEQEREREGRASKARKRSKGSVDRALEDSTAAAAAAAASAGDHHVVLDSDDELVDDGAGVTDSDEQKDDDDDYDGEDDVGDSTFGSKHVTWINSSSSPRRPSALTPRPQSSAIRRRKMGGKRSKAKPKKSKTAGNGATQLRCDHPVPFDHDVVGGESRAGRENVVDSAETVGSDGEAIKMKLCGVIFRRFTDLVRHKENIHGINPSDPSILSNVPEWICNGCGGSFSRKDSRLRHSRVKRCGSID